MSQQEPTEATISPSAAEVQSGDPFEGVVDRLFPVDPTEPAAIIDSSIRSQVVQGLMEVDVPPAVGVEVPRPASERQAAVARLTEFAQTTPDSSTKGKAEKLIRSAVTTAILGAIASTVGRK